MDWSLPDSSGLWNFPGKNTGVYSHSLLQGIFPTQGTQVSCIAGRLFTFWARNLYFGRYLKYSSSTFQRAGETVFSHLPPLTCILVLEFLPQSTGLLRSRMYTWFYSLLFTLPTVSEKISQKTNRLRLKKFRREKKKQNRVLRSWQGVYMTSVPSFWVKLRKHQKLPGASVSLKLHKFSLIFGLLLEVSGREVSGREVKGDLQPCDRWFGWQWEQQGREREPQGYLLLQGHRIESPGETDVVAQW